MTPRKNREGAASRRQRLQSSLPSECSPGRCEKFKLLSLLADPAASVLISIVPPFGLLYPLPRGMSIEFPPFSVCCSDPRSDIVEQENPQQSPRIHSGFTLHYAELFCEKVAIFVAFHRSNLFTFTDSVLYYSRSGNVGGSRAPTQNGIERRENEC